MEIQFITAEVPVSPSVEALQTAIAQTLQQHGKPLRWAITAVNTGKQTLQIEAVVTTQTTLSLNGVPIEVQ